MHCSCVQQCCLVCFKFLIVVFCPVCAVQDIALHAANGCYHSLCPISFQIYIRCTRVCSPSLSLVYTFMLLFLCIIILLSTCYFHFCSKNVTIKFARRTDVMPPVPLETKHHPSSVDLLLIKRLIAETSKQNLLQFLQHEFVNIGKSLAERLIGEKINIYILSVCNSTIKFCCCNNNPSQFFRGNGSRI